MGVFDAIDIVADDGTAATIQRPDRPLEGGYWSNGSWISQQGEHEIEIAEGFGVTDAGAAYFDFSGEVDMGDAVALRLNASTGGVFLG